MTLSERRRARICILTLGFVVAGAVCFDRALAQTPNALLNLNANVQLTKLHPDIKYARIQCTAPLASGGSNIKDGGTQSVTNRSFAGVLSATMVFTQAELSDPANRTVNVTCKLWLGKSITTGDYAHASAPVTEPWSILPANWSYVATGSTVSWTQAVTFPNVAP